MVAEVKSPKNIWYIQNKIVSLQCFHYNIIINTTCKQKRRDDGVGFS